MVPGHSYLPCDRTFGQIEHKIKDKDINCPAEYVQYMQNAVKAGNNVIRMDQKDFFDVKSLLSKVTFRKPREPILFSKGRTFSLHRDNPWVFNIKAAEGSQDVSLEKVKKAPPNKKKGTKNPATPLLLDPLQEKYQGLIPLDAAKLTDLKNLKNFLETRAGKAGVDEVVAQQLTSVPIEVVVDEHEVTSAENIADDDGLDDDTVPAPTVY